MAASFIFSFFGAGVILTFPFVQKLMTWIVGLAVLFVGLMAFRAAIEYGRSSGIEDRSFNKIVADAKSKAKRP